MQVVQGQSLGPCAMARQWPIRVCSHAMQSSKPVGWLECSYANTGTATIITRHCPRAAALRASACWPTKQLSTVPKCSVCDVARLCGGGHCNGTHDGQVLGSSAIGHHTRFLPAKSAAALCTTSCAYHMPEYGKMLWERGV